MASFENMPAAIEQLQATVTNLFQEFRNLRDLQPINENPIDSRELMKRLDISEPTLVRLKKKGLPHYEVGGHARFSFQEVLKYLDSRKRKGGAK